MNRTFTAANTKSLIYLIHDARAHNFIPVIQTDCRDLAVSVLDALGAQYNSKPALIDGIRVLKLSLSVRSDFVVPVFSHKHPVGILPAPFVKIIVNQINCRLDGLVEEWLQ